MMEASQRARSILLVIGGSSALGITSIDALMAMMEDARGYPSLDSVFAPLGVLALAAFAAYWVVVLFVSFVLRTETQRRPVPLATAAGTIVVSFFLISRIGDLIAFSALRADPMGVLCKLGLAGGISVLAGAGAWGWTAAALERRGEFVALRLCTTIALIGALIAIGLAASLTALRDLSGPGLALAAGLGGVLTVTVLAAVQRIHHERALAWLVAAVLLVVFVSPVLTWLEWRRQMLPASRELVGSPEPRHVILITIDALRRDALSIYGSKGLETPVFKALAEDSLVFTHAHSAGPWTIPSMISVLTGIGSDVHRVNTNFASIPDRFKTLAEFMAEAGYRTGAIGHQAQLLRMRRGFDEFDFTPRKLPFHPKTTGGRVLWALSNQDRSTAELTDAVMKWVAKHRNEPFFLWMHKVEPHIPYDPPPAYLPESRLVREHGTQFESSQFEAVRTGRSMRTAEDRQWLRMLYDAEVRYTDAEMGRLIQGLRDSGVYDGALIVVTSDHGEEFWEHESWEHGQSLYEELVSVPLLVKLPHSTHTGRIDAVVSTDALTPTLLDLAGIDHPAGAFTATSLRYLWEGSPAPRSESVAFLAGVSYHEPREGLVFGRYKYVRTLDGKTEELYDLSVDPGERESLVERLPEVAARGRMLLEERAVDWRHHLEEPDDPAVEVDPYIKDALRALGYVE